MVDNAPDGIPSRLPAEASPAPQAIAELLPVIYEELRSLAHMHMSREPRGGAGHTLQTTAIVHEAYIRLANQQQGLWQSREHFLAIASQMIRRVLVDHARARRSLKRGGRQAAVHIHDIPSTGERAHHGAVDVLCLDEALTDLGRLDERQSRIVELRYFGGLSIEETAAALDVSIGTVKGDWRIARAWLKRRLTDEIGA